LSVRRAAQKVTLAKQLYVMRYWNIKMRCLQEQTKFWPTNGFQQLAWHT